MGWNYVKTYIAKHNLRRPDRNAFELFVTDANFLKNGKLPINGIAIHGDVRDLGDCEQITEDSVKMIFSSPPISKSSNMGFTIGFVKS